MIRPSYVIKNGIKKICIVHTWPNSVTTRKKNICFLTIKIFLKILLIAKGVKSAESAEHVENTEKKRVEKDFIYYKYS